MINQDLNEMSYRELQNIAKEVDRTINRKRQEVLLGAYDRFKKIAKEVDATVDEIIAVASKKNRKSRENLPKYRHPNDPSLTCGSLGARPKWFKDLIEEGYKKEELLIN